MRAPSPAQHNDPNPLFLIFGGLAAPFWRLAGWLAAAPVIAALRLYRPCITQVKQDVP
jgi:hypothetical protein